MTRLIEAAKFALKALEHAVETDSRDDIGMSNAAFIQKNLRSALEAEEGARCVRCDSLEPQVMDQICVRCFPKLIGERIVA